MKISTKATFISLIMLFLLAPLTVFAANKVVVIPLFGPDCAAAPACKTLKNVVTVAKANGNFTDPVAAVNSITDASATNPYLVVIAPGVYTITQTLVMKPFVDIAGSGENVTKVKGAISTSNWATSMIIRGSNNSDLSSLTVENTGGGLMSVALCNESASPRMTNVTATASGGVIGNFGVYNYSSSPTMTNVTATGSGGSSSNIGVSNNSYSSPTMTNVTATASGTTSYGVYNLDSDQKIRHTTMSGGTNGLFVGGTSTSIVSQSTIMGGAVGTMNTCVACDNGEGKALDGNCQVIP